MLTLCHGCGHPYRTGRGCPTCTPSRGNSHQRRARRERKLRAGNARCAHCGTTRNLVVDHIYPLSRGGHDTDANTQLLCAACNNKKGDRLP